MSDLNQTIARFESVIFDNESLFIKQFGLKEKLTIDEEVEIDSVFMGLDDHVVLYKVTGNSDILYKKIPVSSFYIWKESLKKEQVR